MSGPPSRTEQFLPANTMGDPALCLSATVMVSVDLPSEHVFDWFTELDISRVLNGYGPLPSVLQTVNQTGPWTAPGARRNLRMSGNINATQEILVSERPCFFAYRVTGFTHLLDLMAHGAEARWWFDQRLDGSTDLCWTYTFWPRFFVAKLAMYPVIRTLWTWYMQQTIQQMKRLAESEVRR